MNDSISNHLYSLGFQHIEEHIEGAILAAVESDQTLEFARISREDRTGYQVCCATADGVMTARALLGGGLRYMASSKLDLPAVGDWVVIRWPQSPTSHLREHADAMIWRLLPRRSRLLRQAAGERTQAQIIAANLDVLFIVSSMNAEFEPRRLERYILAAQESGALPVVVLNKADLARDPDSYIARARAVTPAHTSVVAMACLEQGAGALSPWLLPGQTCAVVGSSGVGKSTIVNELLESNQQVTSAIREDDDEGRHTTTARHLLVMPGGRGVLVDTPGMRELQLWSGEQAGFGELFEELEGLATRCRFRDCRHQDEPGCAILEAIEMGEIDAGRLHSWRKLSRELEWHARRQDVASSRAAQRSRAKMIKQVNAIKRK